MYEGRGRRAHPASEDILGPIRLDMVVYMLTKSNWIVWCGPKKYSNSLNQHGTYRKFGPKSKCTFSGFFQLDRLVTCFCSCQKRLAEGKRERKTKNHVLLFQFTNCKLQCPQNMKCMKLGGQGFPVGPWRPQNIDKHVKTINLGGPGILGKPWGCPRNGWPART